LTGNESSVKKALERFARFYHKVKQFCIKKQFFMGYL
jgi:hypothetical protein